MTATPIAGLARWPEASAALAWPGGGYTYGELRTRVDRLAQLAADHGEPGSPLTIVSASRRKLVLGVLAALRLGRPAQPLDPTRRDLAVCLDACPQGGTLTDEDIDAASAQSGADGRPLRTRADTSTPDIALLAPTSGTAGHPRVAMLSASALDAHVASSAAALPAFGPEDRWLVCLPMTSIGALAALWRVLSAGGCLVLLEHFDADAARRLMAGGASHVSVVPAMLAPLAECRSPPPRGLRCLLSGGGALSSNAAGTALARGWPLWNGWGMTETASHVAVGPVGRDWREGIAGMPVRGADIAVDPGSGRLAIGGPMLMSGYAGARLRPGEGLEPDGRFLSGDLGAVLADGRIEVRGRADDVIVSGGVNIHPEFVERELAACTDAGEVAVTARPDARWGMTLIALYTGPANATSLSAWAVARLPSAARPRSFQRVAALPRNAMGKLLRAGLPALVDANREQQPGEPRPGAPPPAEYQPSD